MPSSLSNLLLLLSSFNLHFLLCHSINDQGRALLAWRQSLNSSSEELNSWSPTHSTPCNNNWFGVVCNDNGDVVHLTLKSMDLQGSLPANLHPLNSLTTLVLSSANLTGPIPVEFGDYSELAFLDVSDNALSGEIPPSLCKLTKLETLFLNTNSLEGAIPVGIGNLSRLTSLTLYDNELDGEIPRSFGALRELEVFRAGGNKNLRGELPWEIGNCTKLVMLGLAETSISGNLPASIGELKRVQTIAIYTSLLSGPIPVEIGNCTELKSLYLYQNSISGPIPKTIGKLKKLESLLLWQNSLVGTIPAELGSCQELKVLDFSENGLTGPIPPEFGELTKLEELQLSVNKLSGSVPEEISGCSALTHLEFDNNEISGAIPAGIGSLKSLTLFFAWQNKLTGILPESLADCDRLQALDLSYNGLSGQIPSRIFGLRNLTKLLLLSNEFSGFIPPDIGSCTSLYRLRLNQNRLSGTVPSEIGNLKNLNFIDLSENRLVGPVPTSILGCESLEFLDLHANGLTGAVPESLPTSLQFVDMSKNQLTGELTQKIGSLSELTKLNLGENRISGSIPPEIRSLGKLQMLDLGANLFAGVIPKELGLVPSLEISLNLSSNRLSGPIPAQFAGLTKLGVLDLSHNALSGDLTPLATLENLVALNVSHNTLSGKLPDTPFFHKLPLSSLAANDGLFISPSGIDGPASATEARSPAAKLVMSILISASAVLILLAVYALIRTRIATRALAAENATWELTFYQKLDLSIDDIVRHLTSSNVIGTGSSGVVYRVPIPAGETLAVKKMWSAEESAAFFGSEIRALSAVRHKNIIRLLGWGSNRSVKLLFYDYLPNGSLSSMLHGAASAGKGVGAEWETRYEVAVGVAHALAYLHHDCVPAIMHGDVKAMNVLLGECNQPYLADFGLARVVPNDDVLSKPHRPHLAGSYGYMAPEHASMQRITEKSDIYSFGVVLLEVLTGRHPLDPTLAGGSHLVQWVRDHLACKRDPSDILDPKLRGRSDPAMHEMLQTLAVSFLCVSAKPQERPTMKDVVAMLKEIRQTEPELSKRALSPVPPSPPQQIPTRKVVSQGSSTNSFTFSDDSMSK